MSRLKFRVWNSKEQKLDYSELIISEMMRCTGFSDCNGHLIYEGDILKYNGIKDTIEWSYGCYVWNGIAIADYDSCFQGEPIGLDSKLTRIVGNKYEDKLY